MSLDLSIEFRFLSFGCLGLTPNLFDRFKNQFNWSWIVNWLNLLTRLHSVQSTMSAALYSSDLTEMISVISVKSSVRSEKWMFDLYELYKFIEPQWSNFIEIALHEVHWSSFTEVTEEELLSETLD